MSIDSLPPAVAPGLAALADPQVLGGTSGPDLTRYLLVCAALLLGVVLLALGLRRLAGKSLAARAARRSLQVMDVLPLGGRSRLAVVRCYDRTFLLGMGEREVSLVAELDPVIEPDGAPLPAEADRRAFASLLEGVQPVAQASREGSPAVTGPRTPDREAGGIAVADDRDPGPEPPRATPRAARARTEQPRPRAEGWVG